MTVLSECDGRDSGIQTDREPSELDWFFDIYIQGSNTTFFRVKSETRVSVIIISHGLYAREDQIDQATKST